VKIMNIGLYANPFLDPDDEEAGNVRQRLPRVYRPRINFDLHPSQARERFRLTTDHVNFVTDRIGRFIEHETEKNCALTPAQQIMLSLRYLATDDNFRTIADAHGVSKATLSRALHRVVEAVNEHLYPEVVDWPSSPAQLRGIPKEFEKHGMSCVFGCADGSHFEIVAPSKDEPQFVNRHGWHSINAFFVAGPKLRFYYVNSKWPGAVGDARVFRNSSLKRRLENGWSPVQFGVLLGDSAYANTNYMVTPIRNPQTRAEQRYNKAHKRTRRIVECAFGVLKQRFRCLLKPMHLKPLFAAEVIRCCAALHNLLMPDDEAEEALEEYESESDDEEPVQDHGDLTRRDQLVALFH